MNAYQPHDKKAKIKKIYFYFLKAHGVLTEYLIRSSTDISWVEMPDRIKEIIERIGHKQISPSKSKQKQRKWTHRSYFVYYDPDANLKPGDAVTFGPKPESDACFLDGADVAEGGKVYAFYCINHMRNAGGDLGPGETETFSVDVNHPDRMTGVDESEEKKGGGEASNLDADRLKLKKIRTHQDSGTNTGPPHS